MNKDTIIEKKERTDSRRYLSLKQEAYLGGGINQNFRNEGVKREIQDQHKKRIR